jgi:hypothetical protein
MIFENTVRPTSLNGAGRCRLSKSPRVPFSIKFVSVPKKAQHRPGHRAGAAHHQPNCQQLKYPKTLVGIHWFHIATQGAPVVGSETLNTTDSIAERIIRSFQNRIGDPSRPLCHQRGRLPERPVLAFQSRNQTSKRRKICLQCRVVRRGRLNEATQLPHLRFRFVLLSLEFVPKLS